MADSFDKISAQLEKEQWPQVYMFKFIVPNEPELIAKVTVLFDATADLKLHPSKTGKYVSVGAKEMMMDSKSVVEKYRKASLIKGIIAL